MPRLYNPTGRKTEAHILETSHGKYYFSYQTCIAFSGYYQEKITEVRIKNAWGPTTGRHFNELGCADFRLVDQGTFNLITS